MTLHAAEPREPLYEAACVALPPAKPAWTSRNAESARSTSLSPICRCVRRRRRRGFVGPTRMPRSFRAEAHSDARRRLPERSMLTILVSTVARIGEARLERRKALRQRLGVTVILREAIDHLLERHDAGGGHDARLAKVAADHASKGAGPLDEGGGPAKQRADGRAQALRDAEGDRIAEGARRGSPARRARCAALKTARRRYAPERRAIARKCLAPPPYARARARCRQHRYGSSRRRRGRSPGGCARARGSAPRAAPRDRWRRVAREARDGKGSRDRRRRPSRCARCGCRRSPGPRRPFPYGRGGRRDWPWCRSAGRDPPPCRRARRRALRDASPSGRRRGKSSPSGAFAMASRMRSVGRVTVSLRRSIGGHGECSKIREARPHSVAAIDRRGQGG